MTGEVSIATIRTSDEFARLTPAWWELWRRSPTATPFQSPAWLLPWWRAFAPGDLAVVAAWRERVLVGLAPFYVESGPRGRRLLPVGISLSDYLDVLFDPACAEMAAEAVVREVLGARDWDEWEWTELAPGALALALPCPAGCTERSDDASLCPTLVFPEGARELRDAVPPRQHRKVRMAQHRAARRGTVEIVEANADPAAFLAALEALHRAGWEERGEPGVMADRRVDVFHQTALPALVAAGLARTYLLRIDGAPTAAYYGLLHRERAYGYLTGFDPSYAFESPGTLLAAHAIAQAIEEGAREFHFLRGQEHYKYAWGALDRVNRRRVFTRVRAHAEAV